MNWGFTCHRKKCRRCFEAVYMQGYKSVSIPMSQGTKLQVNEVFEATNAIVYRSLIWKLLYLTHTRPDIVFAVNLLLRFMTNPTIPLSTTEAEYGALCTACCHRVWMRKILVDCGLNYEELIQMWCDNKSCIAIAKDPTLHGRTKHLDVKLHYI